MSGVLNLYGAQLLAESRKLSCPTALSHWLDYKSLQELDQCDRAATERLFRAVMLGPKGAFLGNARDVLEQIRTQEPAEAARWFYEQLKLSAATAPATMFPP